MKLRTKQIAISTLRLALLCTAGCGVGACGEDEKVSPTPAVVGEEPEDETGTEEEKRLRQMQKIRGIKTIDGSPSEEVAYDVAQLASDLASDCRGQVEAECGVTGPMAQEGCSQLVKLCQAEAFMEIAEYGSAQRSYRVAYLYSQAYGSPVINVYYYTLEVPPQKSAVRAGLAEYARRLATETVAGGVALLDNGGLSGTDFVRKATTRSLIDGSALVERATQQTVDLYARVGETQRSTTSSTSLGAFRVMANPALSRGAAAQVLVGFAGVVGLDNGFCTLPPLTTGAKRALELIRKSGIAPSVVRGTTPIDELIDGPVSGGSVRQRLAAKWSDAELRDGTKSLRDVFGVDYTDFREAREYLVEELDAYSVTDGAVYSTVSDSSGSYSMFSGTLLGAPNRPTAYWNLVASSPWQPSAGGTPIDTGIALLPLMVDDPTIADPTYTRPVDYASFIDRTASLLTHKLGDQAAAIDAAGGQAAVARDKLLNLARDLDSRREGRVTVSFAAANPTFYVYGVDPSEQPEFWKNEDGLECALRGTLGEAPCGEATYKLNTSAAVAISGTTLQAEGYKQGSIITVGASLVGQNHLYLTKKTASGERVLVTGLPNLDLPNRTSLESWTIPVVPSVNEWAAGLLRPSTEWCARTEIDCDGSQFDSRLALENELSADGYDIESSWRYYLERAHLAAAKSDQLGDVLIRSALEVAREDASEAQRKEARMAQVEQELEIVQSVCGTTLSTDELLKVFGVDAELQGIATTSCSVDSDCSAGNEQCLVGRCVKSMFEIEDDSPLSYHRLAECLGEGKVTEAATLGSKPICYWVDSNGKICGGADEANPCPREPAASPDCGSPPTNGETWLQTTSSLGYFDNALRYNVAPEDIPESAFPPDADGNCYKARSAGGGYKEGMFISGYVTYGSGLGECVEADAGYSIHMPPVAKTWRWAWHSFQRDDPDTTQHPGPRTFWEQQGILTCEEWEAEANYRPDDPIYSIYAQENSLRCYEERLRKQLSLRILPRVPTPALDALVAAGPTGVFPELGGSIGSQISYLRGALIRFGENPRLIAEEMHGMQVDGENIRIDMKEFDNAASGIALDESTLDLQKLINSLQLTQVELAKDKDFFSQAAKMVGTMAQGIAVTYATGGVGAALGATGAAAASGAEAQREADQLSLESRILEAERAIYNLQGQKIDLEKANLALEKARRIANHRASLRIRYRNILSYVAETRAALEDFEAYLALIEADRDRARRALGRAVRYATSDSEATVAFRVALNSDIERQRVRYDEARRAAVNAAFMAKRAVEQRLGMRLASMTGDLSLVDAPSTWEASICTSDGVDYSAVTALPDNVDLTRFNDEVFVGDYVDRLDRVVESYRQAYPFADGSDQLVFSLKEDSAAIRESCLVPSYNLLRNTKNLGSSTAWQEACAPGETDCVVLTTFTNPVRSPASVFSSTGYTATLADWDSVFYQTVELEDGAHLVSWYGRAGERSRGFELRDAQGATLSATSEGSESTSEPEWERHWRLYPASPGGSYHVALPRPVDGNPVDYFSPMLEWVSGTTPTDAKPSPFAATEDTAETTQPACADFDGDVFRASRWTRDCVSVCPSGLGTSCDPLAAIQKCYWETQFSISQDAIEKGWMLNQAGFALGNFNYRTESIAVNLVGSGIRDCDGSTTSCYAGGFVPFSLYHHGPFTVRNHLGEDFEVSIFDGTIEHARALASERYLANPMSTTDQTLLAPFIRSEFSGRPLDGSYVLRLWEDNAFNFDALSDVQIFLNYRYWTRAN